MKLQRLPESELLIMKILWTRGKPMFSNEIIEQLPEEKEWKITTLLTLISRLIEKKFVGSLRHGRGYLYSALLSEQDYLEAESGNFLRMLHKGSLKSLVSSLYNSNDIDDNDINELRKWLDEKRPTHD